MVHAEEAAGETVEVAKEAEGGSGALEDCKEALVMLVEREAALAGKVVGMVVVILEAAERAGETEGD